MLINFEAGSPVIILPVSSKSSNLLIGDFGELRVNNSFRFSGDPATISIENNSSGIYSHLSLLLSQRYIA